MTHAVSLQEWSQGKTPDKNDFLSWSNLIYQRSNQVEQPGDDAVSQYFFGQWMDAANNSKMIAGTFERTFSAYGASFQIAVMNQLAQEGKLVPYDLLDQVKPDALLYRHLLLRSDVWSSMEPHQFRDKLYSEFHTIVGTGQHHVEAAHPFWAALKAVDTPQNRVVLFEELLKPKFCSAFGLFSDEHSYFDARVFHSAVKKLSDCWGIHPAQIIYGLLADPARLDYERFNDMLEPYANDIKELIQFCTSPRDERIRSNLLDSPRPVTIDMVFAFALAMDPKNIFLSTSQIPKTQYDPEAADALGAAFQ